MKKQNNQKAGFSLLELLLAVGLIASILVGAIQITRYYADRALAKANAGYMLQIANAMDNILRNEINFLALYNATVAAGSLELTADNPGAPLDILDDFVVGGVTIESQLRISPTFSGFSPLRTGIRILLWQADNAANPLDPQALHYLIVTTEPRPLMRVRAAALELGAAGGLIDVGDYAAQATATFSGAMNGWNLVPSTVVAGSGWYAGMPATLNIADEGTYLAYLGYQNLQEIAADHLFRRDIGIARLNSMFGPLNLGGNNIVGADNINVRNQALTTAECDPGSPAGVSLCVRGPVMAEGAVNLQGGMDLSGDLRAEQTGDIATRLMSVDGRIELTGNLVVDSQNAASVDGITVFGNATMRNGSTATSATAITTNARDVFLPPDDTDPMTPPRGITNVTSSFGGNEVIANTIQSDILRAGNDASDTLNVRNTLNNRGNGNDGTLPETRTLINGNLEVLDLNAGRLNTPTLNTGTARVNTLGISTFGTCGSGCGN